MIVPVFAALCAACSGEVLPTAAEKPGVEASVDVEAPPASICFETHGCVLSDGLWLCPESYWAGDRRGQSWTPPCELADLACPTTIRVSCAAAGLVVGAPGAPQPVIPSCAPGCSEVVSGTAGTDDCAITCEAK